MAIGTDTKPFVRDPDAVKQALKETPTGQIVVNQPCRIHIPERFSSRGLAFFGDVIHIFGLYALILNDNKYSVCNVNAMQAIDPLKFVTVEINGVRYHEFLFDENSVVIKDTTLVKNDLLIFNILDEVYLKGKVPWYVGYDDLGRLFNTSKKHAGSGVNDSLAAIELIASVISRDPTDLTKYYRNIAEKQSDVVTNPPSFIPMMSAYYGASGTLHKIAGAYFNDGLVSALVYPSDTVDKVEELLRV